MFLLMKHVLIFSDTKDSQGVQASNINEIAFNAVAVKWNPRDSNVKVNSHINQYLLYNVQLILRFKITLLRHFFTRE